MKRRGFLTCDGGQGPLTLSRRTTYIRHAVRYLKSQTYICRNQCDDVWSNFVHSYYAYCVEFGIAVDS